MITFLPSAINVMTMWKKRTTERQEKSEGVKHQTIGIMTLTWLLILIGINGSTEATENLLQNKSGVASFYGQEACQWNPHPRCPTASGKSLYALEHQGIRYAAAWDYPFGTRLQVCRQDDPTRCTQVVILDRGPARRLHRLIDLNATSFAELAPLTDGVVKVTVEGRGWAD